MCVYMMMMMQEKERAVQMWRVAAQELDRLQKLYQTTMRDEHIHTTQHQHTQVYTHTHTHTVHAGVLFHH